MVPTWAGKPGVEMRKLFPAREKSENFEQSGRVGENYPKYWKMREFYPKYWKSEESLASLCIFLSLTFLVEVPLLNRFLYLLNSVNETCQNNAGKWKENTGKVREICQSKNVGTMKSLP